MKSSKLARTYGTKECKDIIRENNGISINEMTCIRYKNVYSIYVDGDLVVRMRDIDIALDWMVENGYIHETRLRLTAKQKDVIRNNIFSAVCAMGMLVIPYMAAMYAVIRIFR